MREHDHRHRMVPPWPVTALVVIQAEFFFALAITWYGERLVCCSRVGSNLFDPYKGAHWGLGRPCNRAAASRVR